MPEHISLVRRSGLAVDVGVERSWRSHVEVVQHLQLTFYPKSNNILHMAAGFPVKET